MSRSGRDRTIIKDMFTGCMNAELLGAEANRSLGGLVPKVNPQDCEKVFPAMYKLINETDS